MSAYQKLKKLVSIVDGVHVYWWWMIGSWDSRVGCSEHGGYVIGTDCLGSSIAC